MPAHSKRLILFTRYPASGTTKTRLIPELGEEGAANVQRHMTELVTQKAKAVALQKQLDIFVYYSDGTKELMQEWLGADLTFIKQQGDDIGDRMAAAFADAARDKVDHAVLIGSDIPAITEAMLFQAFTALGQNDVVLGPTQDGGYYLIGLVMEKYTDLTHKLFTNIPWSTERVYTTTLERLKRENINVASLPKLHDIDRPEDLIHLPL